MKNENKPRRNPSVKLGENGCRKKTNMVEGPSGMSYFDHLKKAAERDPDMRYDLNKLYYSNGHRKNKIISSYDL